MATSISNDEMQTLWRIAEAMNASGDYKGKRGKDGSWSGITTNEQAFNRILIGRDLGLSPAQAMMGIDLVRGNLQIRAVLLASFVRQSRDYNYEVLEHDERGCTLKFWGRSFSSAHGQEWAELGESTFTIEDAAHAKLIRDGSPWETVPRNMVFARAMSNGVKWYCPDLLGGVPVYTEGDDLTGVEASAIGAVEGEPVEPGWQGVSVADAAKIEKVIRRAERLGHAGLLNRAAVQMALNGQSREYVRGWIAESTAALDRLRDEQDADSERVHAEEQAVREEHGEAFPASDSPQSEEEGRVDEPRNPADALHDELLDAPEREPEVHPEQTALAVPEELDQEIALAKQAVASATSEREEKERRKTLEILEASKARLQR
jgi:hypothetical protein